MNIFEAASRRKFRFPSAKGDLTVEQVWDLPLTASDQAREAKTDLDTVARAINAELRSMTEESFVTVRPDRRKIDLEIKLDLVKHVIAVKMKEAEDASVARDNAAKRRRLTEILATKEDDALASMSTEEIQKRIAEIDAAAKPIGDIA